MIKIFKSLYLILPDFIKKHIAFYAIRYRNRPFKQYLKKKNIEGVVFDFWIGDRDGRDWYDLQCSDPVWKEMRFIKDYLIKQEDVILECGGHHGCTAILLSNWVGANGKVVTFEPSIANCEIIMKNIKQNELKNVTLERKAVGNKRGIITINSASNASVTISGKGEKVEITCLDDYKHLKPSFLKIDVEGFEMQVIEGAKDILSTHPKLAIEVHTDQLSQYGASVESIFKLINIEKYKIYIQWEDNQKPEIYDFKRPIDKRVHLFCIPLEHIEK